MSWRRSQRPIGVARGERDFYALWIANSWLGETSNQSSQLFNVIREKRGLNYGDGLFDEAERLRAEAAVLQRYVSLRDLGIYEFAYLIASICFIMALRGLSSPVSAR